MPCPRLSLSFHCLFHSVPRPPRITLESQLHGELKTSRTQEKPNHRPVDIMAPVGGSHFCTDIKISPKETGKGKGRGGSSEITLTFQMGPICLSASDSNGQKNSSQSEGMSHWLPFYQEMQRKGVSLYIPKNLPIAPNQSIIQSISFSPFHLLPFSRVHELEQALTSEHRLLLPRLDLALTFPPFQTSGELALTQLRQIWWAAAHLYLHRIAKNHANPQAYPRFTFRALSEDAPFWRSSALWSHPKTNRHTVPISWCPDT